MNERRAVITGSPFQPIPERTDTDMTDTTNTETKDGGNIREQAREAMQREDLSLRDLAKELEVSHPMLSRYLEGSPSASLSEALEPALQQWLEKLATRPAAERERFVETASAEKICSTLAYAQAYGDMVAIYGGPGVGKTRSIYHYRSQRPNVWIATITPATAAVVPALEEVSEAVGLPDANGGARRLSRAIRQKVFAIGGLLIIDEAQHLSMAAVEELRAIHDFAEVGLALVGNEVSYARLAGGGNRSAHFAQITSRLGMRLYLRRPDERDVESLARRYGVTSKKSLELLERIAAKPGALRSVVKVLRLANSLSSNPTPSFEVLRQAVDRLGAEA